MQICAATVHGRNAASRADTFANSSQLITNAVSHDAQRAAAGDGLNVDPPGQKCTPNRFRPDGRTEKVPLTAR
jgi:hypothetical protein